MQNSQNYGATLAQAQAHLTALEPFHTGTLSAEWEFMVAEDHSAYIVRSYGTTIARRSFTDGSEWVFPSAYTFSATTSKHANLVKKAWGI